MYSEPFVWRHCETNQMHRQRRAFLIGYVVAPFASLDGAVVPFMVWVDNDSPLLEVKEFNTEQYCNR